MDDQRIELPNTPESFNQLSSATSTQRLSPLAPLPGGRHRLMLPPIIQPSHTYQDPESPFTRTSTAGSTTWPEQGSTPTSDTVQKTHIVATQPHTIPIRILTCHCEASETSNHHPTYKGLPGTMDITNVTKHPVLNNPPSQYKTFVLHIQQLLHNKLNWEKKSKVTNTVIPDHMKTFSDYYINDKHFINYDYNVAATISHPPEHHRVRILLVPSSFTLPLLNGPYSTLLKDKKQKQSVDASDPQDPVPAPDEASQPPSKRNLIPLDHIHNLTKSSFKQALADNWKNHTVLVYIKRRKAQHLFTEFRNNPEQFITNHPGPTSPEGLQSDRLALIDAELARCAAELRELGVTL